MNYMNGSPIGGDSESSSYSRGKSRYYTERADYTVFMTFEQLAETWKCRSRRKDEWAHSCM